MPHITKMSKQGNSLGVILPKELLAKLGLARGDVVAISLNQGRIEINRLWTATNECL